MSQSSPWELSLYDTILDSYRDLIFSVHRVEVPWLMISIKHGNHNPKESAQLRHTSILTPLRLRENPHNVVDEWRGQAFGASTVQHEGDALSFQFPASHEGKSHVHSIHLLGSAVHLP